MRLIILFFLFANSMLFAQNDPSNVKIYDYRANTVDIPDRIDAREDSIVIVYFRDSIQMKYVRMNDGMMTLTAYDKDGEEIPPHFNLMKRKPFVQSTDPVHLQALGQMPTPKPNFPEGNIPKMPPILEDHYSILKAER
jgi:hypothetical protein